MFNHSGGYGDYSLGENKYQVVYESGHGWFGDETKAYDFALLRASELTVAKGFSEFEIYRQDTDPSWAVLYIQLTNSKTETTINAKATLVKIRQQYGLKVVEPVK